jgi:LacI family transcriptional regulator
MGRRATLADVAREVGISPSTVSRALDPSRSSMVNSATRERVIAAAERLGYRPDVQARSLMTGRTQTIAVIAADLGNTWVTPILHGIASRVSVEGIVPIIAETSDDSAILANLIDHMLSRRVDGMIVLGARHQDATVISSAARIVPIVVAARDLPNIDVPMVSVNDRLGGEMVAEHFADLGHETVAQLMGPPDVSNFSLRRKGFSGVAKRRRLREVPILGEAIRPTQDEGYRLMVQLLDEAEKLPTAVFAQNDPMAVGAMTVLRERGLRIPDDVSIAGYNDMPLTALLDPGLTTVRYPGWEVGHAAAGVALRLLDGEVDVDSVCLEPEFVPRNSTAPVSDVPSAAPKRAPSRRRS